ncbi:MAG: hypothetical protein CTY20_00755 [Hyphomicrobium sp.]|nr:MAG: hypothetical protein CTY20_00755 [Hyphomicrobium sp.]
MTKLVRIRPRVDEDDDIIDVTPERPAYKTYAEKRREDELAEAKHRIELERQQAEHRAWLRKNHPTAWQRFCKLVTTDDDAGETFVVVGIFVFFALLLVARLVWA